MKSDDETVIFLHIPKTAGTTLHHILERCYPRDQIWTLKDGDYRSEIESFQKLAPKKREAYRLIKGHLSFGFHRYVPGHSTYITFLREPIARTLSFYYYARTQPDHYLYPALRDDRFDLKILLKEQTEITHEFFNLQTSMIAGDEWGNPRRPANREALEQAKQNLRTQFALVGLTEEFDASLRLLKRRFGWKVRFYSRKNVTSRKPRLETINAETLRLLREANMLDIELYQFAAELFAAQCGVGPNQPSRRVSFASGIGSYLKRVSKSYGGIGLRPIDFR